MTNTAHAHTAVPGDFAPASPSFLKATGNAISGFFTSLAMALAAHRLYHEIDGLGDAELAKLGMTRKDIPGYVARSMGWLEDD